MLRLEMLPVGDGDCLILSWGDESAPRHVLVDGGLPRASNLLGARLKQIADGGGRLELLVVTHMDADHIGGILRLCENGGFPVEVGEVWFNEYAMLPGAKPMSMGQADRLSTAIRKNGWALNLSFSGAPVKVADDASPVTVELAGGLKLTVLSPDNRKLAKLQREWTRCRAEMEAQLAARETDPLPHGVRSMSSGDSGFPSDVKSLADRPEDPDTETANGSSIAFVAEYQGRRVLFAADAHPDILCSGIRQLPLVAGRLELELFKVSHHGSRRNTTRELAKLLSCGRYAVSAAGTRQGSPAIDAVAKLLVYTIGQPRRLHFNHSGAENERWADEKLDPGYGLICEFPPDGQSSVIELAPS